MISFTRIDVPEDLEKNFQNPAFENLRIHVKI